MRSIHHGIMMLHTPWLVIRFTLTQVHQLVVSAFVEEYQDKFLRDMGSWIREGKMAYKEDVTQGIENAPATFAVRSYHLILLHTTSH
jgi:NADPH-dependent curcumin reductase CurA